MILHGGSLKLRHIMLGISTKNMTKLFKQHNEAMEHSVVTCFTVRERIFSSASNNKIARQIFSQILSLVQDFY